MSGAETRSCQVKPAAFQSLLWLRIKYLAVAACVTPEICSGLNLLIDAPTAVLWLPQLSMKGQLRHFVPPPPRFLLASLQTCKHGQRDHYWIANHHKIWAAKCPCSWVMFLRNDMIQSTENISPLAVLKIKHLHACSWGCLKCSVWLRIT